jgi:hypothetical protein
MLGGLFMEIDVRINGESLCINIEDPFRFDITSVTENINNFGNENGIDLSSFEMGKLIPRMIKGVAGCEGGCPADAKNLVSQGFRDFSLSYVEGGILTAACKLSNGTPLEVKVFPEFD